MDENIFVLSVSVSHILSFFFIFVLLSFSLFDIFIPSLGFRDVFFVLDTDLSQVRLALYPILAFCVQRTLEKWDHNCTKVI